ncbi:MAG: hypothetical protein DRJ97_01170 [Thermoprotei archaeon]|nr:MAG: hypothetical protein DRJ97_01170 [Thermoprotei archaeon]
MERDEVEERFKRMASLALGLSPRDVEEASKRLINVNPRPPRRLGLIVDYLDPFEASIVLALLERGGARRFTDFELVPVGERFILAARRSKPVEEALKKLDKLKELSYVKPYAVRVLKEWRAKTGVREGDVDEALDVAYAILEAREKAVSKKCPRCGKESAVRVYERVRDGLFVIIVERACCGFVERVSVPINRWEKAKQVG